ncbi:HugZ family protein [Rhizobium leguminosarum bv. viciae]|uniref:HugZ family pyridoxamine 5'-phosphate oxidase n=1 Tax=Rhizobium leguminosarum TaxID=384 RepID=UPI00103FD63A|nr:pyridoxamine 5'-phosphate oxidase family protein [Rhizobium leguminosarum]MBY5751917.1 HugZ family protein [Rhizobium leguminosarum]MBY5788304.1 HugZ family protein [Rhizobium leguminosarum]TBY80462.1 HugZ family protein [Rhizobium leguminosarum bv. viciae]
MKDQPSPLRETDDEARKLARVLLRSARYAAIAVLDPETGFPFASRVLVATDIDGTPVILVSKLSAHTKALAKDPRASLLTGEPGKGDPLAYPRLTTQCLAELVERGNAIHERIRTRFLDRHSKAALYIDFPDFLFFRLKPEQASLNGGFGRAYLLDGNDLVIQSAANEAIAAEAAETVRDLVERHPDIAEALAIRLKAPESSPWRICGIDSSGFDMISGDFLLRYEFETLAVDADHICSNMSKVAYSIP